MKENILLLKPYNKISEKQLKQLKKLGINFIISQSTGLDHIPIEKALENEINVLNIPDYSSRAVAEYSIMLALILARKYPNFEQGTELYGKTAGIIGRGNIGNKIEEYCKGFNMKTITYDLIDKNTKTDLQYLIQTSHFIFLCLPLNENTKNFFKETDFKTMLQKPYIINCARKELIDLKTIEDALDDQLISGYAIDEEIPYYYKSNQNIISTPHTAFNTKESEQKEKELIFKKIQQIRNSKNMNIEM